MIIDRFEDEFVVVEMPDGKKEICPRAIFPQNVKEGDVVEVVINQEATEKRRAEMKSKMNELFRKNKRSGK